MVYQLSFGDFRMSTSLFPEALRDIGAVQAEQRGAHTWRFTGQGSSAEVSVLSDAVVRVRFAGREALPDPPSFSWTITGAYREPEGVQVRQEEGAVVLETGKLRVRADLHPLRLSFSTPDGVLLNRDLPERGLAFSGDVVACSKALPATEHSLGFGEHTGRLDCRGSRVKIYNTDPPQHHTQATGPMHAGIPFFIALNEGRPYGIFLDNTYAAEFDMGLAREDAYTFGAAGGTLVYYFFAGETPAEVLAHYTHLTGSMPLPPKWALGYQQSRWSYYSDENLRDLTQGFRRRAIPCDVVYLDIDYMHKFRDFTFDPERFPDPTGLLGELRQQGFKIVPIIDPGIKAEDAPDYPVFREGREGGMFCLNDAGELATGQVWPGECAFPDFTNPTTRAWWGDLHRPLVEAGVAGVWDDMNEPAITRPDRTTLPPTTRHTTDYGPAFHAEVHNVYGMEMARSTYEGLRRLRPDERAFVLSRAGYAGLQRYAALWTGDNSSWWAHLELDLQMCQSLNMSGIALVGADVGGFWGESNGELLARWTQLGAFLPFFRNHNSSPRDQEPWAFGQPWEDICRRAIEFRYRLLPYLYTLVEQCNRTGAPIIRPLIYEYPQDPAALAQEDEFFCGSDLLVAPMTRPGLDHRLVYLPPGRWTHYWSGKQLDGPSHLLVKAPLSEIPLFVREGAILPLGPVMQYVDQQPTDPLTLELYPAATPSSFSLYEDDGTSMNYRRGIAAHTTISTKRDDAGRTMIEITPTQGSYQVTRQWYEVRLHSLPGRPASVQWGEDPLSELPATASWPHPLTSGWRWLREVGGVLQVWLRAEESTRQLVLAY